MPLSSPDMEQPRRNKDEKSTNDDLLAFHSKESASSSAASERVRRERNQIHIITNSTPWTSKKHEKKITGSHSCIASLHLIADIGIRRLFSRATRRLQWGCEHFHTIRKSWTEMNDDKVYDWWERTKIDINEFECFIFYIHTVLLANGSRSKFFIDTQKNNENSIAIHHDEQKKSIQLYQTSHHIIQVTEIVQKLQKNNTIKSWPKNIQNICTRYPAWGLDETERVYLQIWWSEKVRKILLAFHQKKFRLTKTNIRVPLLSSPKLKSAITVLWVLSVS